MVNCDQEYFPAIFLLRRKQSSSGLSDIITMWSLPLIFSTLSGGFLSIIHCWKSFFPTSSFSETMKTRLTEPYLFLEKISSFNRFSMLYLYKRRPQRSQQHCWLVAMVTSCHKQGNWLFVYIKTWIKEQDLFDWIEASHLSWAKLVYFSCQVHWPKNVSSCRVLRSVIRRILAI